MEKWKREVREVEMAEDGDEGELPPQYKLTARKRILVGKVTDHIRWKETELETRIRDKGKIKYTKMYEEIEKEVYGYVRLLKLEKQRKSEKVQSIPASRNA